MSIAEPIHAYIPLLSFIISAFHVSMNNVLDCLHLVRLFALFVYLGVQSTFLTQVFCDRLEGFMFCSTVFVYISKMTFHF